MFKHQFYQTDKLNQIKNFVENQIESIFFINRDVTPYRKQ